MFRTIKYWPDYPNRPFASKGELCEWVATFVECCNHQHRHSSIKFETPHQRQSGHAVEICRQRAHIYEKARKKHPRRWSRSSRCWRQPEVVWINKTPEEPLNSGSTISSEGLKISQGATTFMKATEC
ncbi:hypothetical protein [Cyanobium sp. Morenito 9A2]|uniref:hypothetical protein n=1 Tax=Cyanobium sp. Morenito 9A2 TaxID=2823718 RepID=UPI0020CEEC31|nr:hypothetical protein [Cyanobium sp. Morenito 9A2]